MTHDSQVEAVMALVDNYRHALASVDPWTGSGYTKAGEAYAEIRTALSALAAGKVEAEPGMAFCPACFVEVKASEVAQQTLDARRYRWWREYAMQTEDVSPDDAFMECETPADVDAVIDAAMLAASPSPLSADPESAVVGAAKEGR